MKMIIDLKNKMVVIEAFYIFLFLKLYLSYLDIEI
jgi:hypothetical protein